MPSRDENLLFLKTEEDINEAIEMGVFRPELKDRLLQLLQEAEGGLIRVDLTGHEVCPDATQYLGDRPRGFISYH